MARFKHVMGALAAAGLTLAQPAMAAARTGTPIGEAEAQAEGPGSAMIIGLLGMLGLVFAIMAATTGGNPVDDLPTSP